MVVERGCSRRLLQALVAVALIACSWGQLVKENPPLDDSSRSAVTIKIPTFNLPGFADLLDSGNDTDSIPLFSRSLLTFEEVDPILGRIPCEEYAALVNENVTSVLVEDFRLRLADVVGVLPGFVAVSAAPDCPFPNATAAELRVLFSAELDVSLASLSDPCGTNVLGTRVRLQQLLGSNGNIGDFIPGAAPILRSFRSLNFSVQEAATCSLL